MKFIEITKECEISTCRQVHITEATLSKLDHLFHVEPYLSDPIQTYLIVPTVAHSNSYTPVKSLLQQTSCTDFQTSMGSGIEESSRRKSSGSGRTSIPKYTECYAADKPFASISEDKLLDNITTAVSLISTSHDICEKFSCKG